jgi:hypothetical protein
VDGRRELLYMRSAISRAEFRLRRVEPKLERLTKRLAYLEREVRRGYRSYIVKTSHKCKF